MTASSKDREGRQSFPGDKYHVHVSIGLRLCSPAACWRLRVAVDLKIRRSFGAIEQPYTSSRAVDHPHTISGTDGQPGTDGLGDV